MIKGFNSHSLSHLNGSAEEFFLRDLDIDVIEHDFNFNKEFLSEAVTLRALEAKVNLSNLEAGCNAIAPDGLEL